jgi:alpha-1,6-mannosyltransferase
VTERRLLAAGTFGSALVAAGGWGSGALPPGESSWAGGRALVVVGVLLLSAAWWRLRTRALHAALLWSAPLLLAPPMFSRDVYAYAGQGLLVARGLDPYDTGPGTLDGPLVDGVDDVWRDAPSPYGPLWLALAGGVVRLTGESLLPALLGMRLLAVLGLLLAGWALHRLGGERALWLGLANPLVLLHLVAGAHNEALMVGLLLAGLALRRRLVLAAVLIMLGALVKLPALAVLGFVVMAVPGRWGARLRAAALTGAVAAATAVAASLATGLGWGWLTTLDAGRARLSLLSVTTGLGVALPGGDAVLDAVLAAGLLGGAAITAVLLWRTPRLGPARAAGLALLAVALLLPVVQPWYVLWGVLPLATAVTRREAAALGAFCLVLALLVWPSGRHVVRPPLYGVPMLLAGAAAVLVLRRRDEPADRHRDGRVEVDNQARPSPRRPETP